MHVSVGCAWIDACGCFMHGMGEHYNQLGYLAGSSVQLLAFQCGMQVPQVTIIGFSVMNHNTMIVMKCYLCQNYAIFNNYDGQIMHPMCMSCIIMKVVHIIWKAISFSDGGQQGLSDSGQAAV